MKSNIYEYKYSLKLLVPINYMISDIFITLKAHIGQQDREKTIARINEGLAVAKARGKKLGRPQSELTKEFIKEYKKFKACE